MSICVQLHFKHFVSDAQWNNNEYRSFHAGALHGGSVNIQSFSVSGCVSQNAEQLILIVVDDDKTKVGELL